MEDCEHTSSWTVAVQLSQFVRCKHSHWNTRVQKWHSVKFGSRAVNEPWGNVQYAVNSRICKHVLRTAVQFSSCCKQDLTSSYSTDRERWIAAAMHLPNYFGSRRTFPILYNGPEDGLPATFLPSPTPNSYSWFLGPHEFTSQTASRLAHLF